MIDKTKLEHDLETAEGTRVLSFRALLKVLLACLLALALFFLAGLLSDIREQEKKISALESDIRVLQNTIKDLGPSKDGGER